MFRDMGAIADHQMPDQAPWISEWRIARSWLEGPVPAFEALATGKNATPRMLEAYARYLRLTGGDDPAVHLAQDLARRAANAAPTLARHLLAAELSDDRNEKREWLSRAQELVGERSHPIELLLAQAELARTGTIGAMPRLITTRCWRAILSTFAACSVASSSTERRGSSGQRS